MQSRVVSCEGIDEPGHIDASEDIDCCLQHESNNSPPQAGQEVRRCWQAVSTAEHRALRTKPTSSDRRLVRDRCDRLRDVVLCFDRPRLSGPHGLSLEVHMGPVLLGFSPSFRVRLDPSEEFLSRSRRPDVLDAQIDALLHVSIANPLVHDHADGGFGDVVDDAGLAVVDLEWHAGEGFSILVEPENRRPT